MTLRLVAAVPVKALEQAKSRLSEAVADRAGLSLRMLGSVARALQAAGTFAAIAVISEDARALSAARELGLVALRQQSHGLNEACAEASAWATEQGADGLLIAHADLPRLSATEVRSLVAELGTLLGSSGRSPALDTGEPGAVEGREASPSCRPAVLLAPDRADRGTNLVLACPPDVMRWRFGPDSFALHQAEAVAQGVRLGVFRSPGSGHDVDTAADLAAWAGGLP